MCQRTPVKVKRKPITMLSKAGHRKYGGWMVFDRPIDQQPPNWRTKGDERVLWCPWCGEWSIFKRRFDERDVWNCQGVCGWANTKEFYVRTANRLWWEDVPLKEMQKITRSRR